MTGALLALLASGLWGAGDFLGGQESRRLPLLVVVLGSQLAGLAALLPQASRASQTVKGCRIPGQGCARDKQCCSGKCRNKQCACLDHGKSCLVVVSAQLPPLPNKAVCCSSKCTRGTHKCT